MLIHNVLKIGENRYDFVFSQYLNPLKTVQINLHFYIIKIDVFCLRLKFQTVFNTYELNLELQKF